MIAVDTSALVAILRREPEADRLLRALANADACILSAVTFLEASIVLTPLRAERLPWAPLDELITEAAIELVAHDSDQAALSRLAFLRFGKGRHPAALNIGDCASYALAKSRAVPLLYKGQDFAKTDLAAAI